VLQAFLKKWEHLWLAPNDWKSYEAYVSGSLKRRFPHADVAANQKLKGKKSGVIRQIDVLVTASQQVAVDCKCYRRKVDVKHVEAFLGMLDDLGIAYGVLVTTKGYTKAALARAKNDPRKNDLQILSPNRLSEYQHVGAPLIWMDSVGIFLECPPGWVTDSDGGGERGYLVAMYPLGHTIESAKRHAEFMYGNILRKDDNESLESVAAHHEADILADAPESVFRHQKLLLKDQKSVERQAFLRTAQISTMNFGVEHSLYTDYGTHVLLLVLLSPPGQENRTEKLLTAIAEKSFEMTIDDKRPKLVG
jgi:hypothetical protein